MVGPFCFGYTVLGKKRQMNGKSKSADASNISAQNLTSHLWSSFCVRCILEWSKISNTCPLCKQRFNTVRHKRLNLQQASSSKEKGEKFPGGVIKTHQIPDKDQVGALFLFENKHYSEVKHQNESFIINCDLVQLNSLKILDLNFPSQKTLYANTGVHWHYREIVSHIFCKHQLWNIATSFCMDFWSSPKIFSLHPENDLLQVLESSG